MSYELSFSEEFFLAEGEPYDRSNDAVNADGKPISVWSAITMMSDDERKALAEYFEVEPEYLTAETVLDKIRETNTCSNMNSPVEVWVDPEGYHTVMVYDGPDVN